MIIIKIIAEILVSLLLVSSAFYIFKEKDKKQKLTYLKVVIIFTIILIALFN